MDREISRGRLRTAWGIAIAADFLQIVAFPVFWQGAASPADDVLDVVVAGALLVLIGWHWSFIPSFLVKLAPALDVVPTWSAAVFLATRGAGTARPRTGVTAGNAAEGEVIEVSGGVRREALAGEISRPSELGAPRPGEAPANRPR